MKNTLDKAMKENFSKSVLAKLREKKLPPQHDFGAREKRVRDGDRQLCSTVAKILPHR